MKPICYKDTELLSRFPIGRWFYSGAYSIHGSKLSRLARLGLIDKKPAHIGASATWQYLRSR